MVRRRRRGSALAWSTPASGAATDARPKRWFLRERSDLTKLLRPRRAHSGRVPECRDLGITAANPLSRSQSPCQHKRVNSAGAGAIRAACLLWRDPCSPARAGRRALPRPEQARDRRWKSARLAIFTLTTFRIRGIRERLNPTISSAGPAYRIRFDSDGHPSQPGFGRGQKRNRGDKTEN